MNKKELYRMTEHDVHQILENVKRRVLREGTADWESLNTWNDIRERIGDEGMLDYLWDYMDSDTIHDFLNYAKQQLLADGYDLDGDGEDDEYEDEEEGLFDESEDLEDIHEDEFEEEENNVDTEEIANAFAHLRSHIFEMPNGDVIGFDYDEHNNMMYAGYVTNGGCSREYELEYDPSFDIDGNLEGLYEMLMETGEFYSDDEE